MRENEWKAKTESGYWVYGVYYKHQKVFPCPFGDYEEKEEDYEHFIIQDGFTDWNMPRGIEFRPILPETVCQFTGVRMGNMKIYEGDIIEGTEEEFDGGYLVSRNTYEGRVFWDEKNGWWAVEDMPSGDEYPLYDYAFDRVIGNIIDSPDFFKKRYMEEEEDEE